MTFRRPSAQRANSPPGGGLRDVVDDWKRVVVEQLRDEASARAGWPSLRVSFALGFFLVAILVGFLGGIRGVLWTVALLVTVLLAQELPRALVAHRFGRASRVVFLSFGSTTELHGKPLRGLSGALFATIGSLTNLALAGAALLALERGVSEPAAPFFASAALCHAAWGLAQMLPVAPLRAHALIAGLRPQIRLIIALIMLIALARSGSMIVESSSAITLLPVLALTLGASVRSVLDGYRDMWDATAKRRARAAFALVHSRLRGRVCDGLGIRVHARRLAVRRRGSNLGAGRATTVATESATTSEDKQEARKVGKIAFPPSCENLVRDQLSRSKSATGKSANSSLIRTLPEMRKRAPVKTSR